MPNITYSVPGAECNSDINVATNLVINFNIF